ncbi:class I SAM-dependent methyltransferase [Methylosoma difficile]
MQRVLEPELMDDPEQVKAYAEADFSVPHNQFIERLAAFIAEPEFNGTALDLGCGPGDISQRFAQAFPNCQVHAVDGAEAMLNYAQNHVPASVSPRLHFIKGLLPHLLLPHAHYPLIFCNSLLHHLPDPHALWQTIKRYSEPGTRIVVMDLLRPTSTAQAKALVQTYAANEPALLQRDFYQSLLAAFELDEIRQQLHDANLPLHLEQTSDRHVLITGVVS